VPERETHKCICGIPPQGASSTSKPVEEQDLKHVGPKVNMFHLTGGKKTKTKHRLSCSKEKIKKSIRGEVRTIGAQICMLVILHLAWGSL
jgi:hypothetical protein